jgi:aspartyl-tRNA(Asn)/glutamyl-tRNA(Gln) amidotransferase subunit C
VSFTSEDVRRLAALARLELSPAELDDFTRQFADILELVRRVEDVQSATTGDLSLEHVLPPSPPVREDEVQPSLDLGGRQFKVPRVLNG